MLMVTGHGIVTRIHYPNYTEHTLSCTWSKVINCNARVQFCSSTSCLKFNFLIKKGWNRSQSWTIPDPSFDKWDTLLITKETVRQKNLPINIYGGKGCHWNRRAVPLIKSRKCPDHWGWFNVVPWLKIWRYKQEWECVGLDREVDGPMTKKRKGEWFYG